MRTVTGGAFFEAAIAGGTMLLEGYRKEIFRPKCNPEFASVHCFGYTVEDIRRDVVRHGRSTILERLREEKKGGRCACAAKNPMGR